jgi:imidazolonepropionase-like amidohydrolase
MLVLKGRVIDGTGADPIEKGVVVVEGNTIRAVLDERDYSIPPGAQVIDVGSGAIMPGFIDLHTHLGCVGSSNMMMLYTLSSYEKTCQAVYDMERLIEAGFTSVRECGGFANYLKDPIAKGLVRGPRITAAGAVITQTGGHADGYQKFPPEFNVRNDMAVLVDGVDEMRKACRLQFRAGAEFIKIMTTGGVTSQGDSPRHRQFSDSEILAAVEEAEMHDTYVSTHAQTLAGIKAALRCGVKSIEHVFEIDDEAIEMFLKNEAWIVPTFTILNCYIEKSDLLPPAVSEKAKWALDRHRKSISRAYETGIKIGFGADLISDPLICPYGEKNLEEFLHLAEIGMSPMEAIVAATKTGSEIIMKESQVGTLEPGKLADIAVCAGNPLEDIRTLRKIDNIKLVVMDGKIEKNTL